MDGRPSCEAALSANTPHLFLQLDPIEMHRVGSVAAHQLEGQSVGGDRMFFQLNNVAHQNPLPRNIALSFSPTLTFREGMNVLLARTEEIQKIHPHVFAGLADTQ